jgi:uncharacterized membrane protein
VRKALILTAVVALLSIAASASAAPLPENCTKEQGTVTCTTFDGPGKNQGGVGVTTIEQGQGNIDNESPEEQQGHVDSQTCNPPSSQGRPCNP